MTECLEASTACAGSYTKSSAVIFGRAGMNQAAARLAGRLVGAFLAVFPNCVLAQTSTSKADAPDEYIFGAPPFAYNDDPAYANSGSVSCKASGPDLYTDANNCFSHYFRSGGPWFRNDLGLDRFGSLPPSDYMFVLGPQGPGQWYEGPRCPGYVQLSGTTSCRLLST
jgi:hypothetical protein